MTTKDLFELYLVGKRDSLSQGKPTLDNTTLLASAPFALVLKRGRKLSYCSGSNNGKSSPDILFKVHSDDALAFPSVSSAFDYLTIKIQNPSFIAKMINLGQFQVVGFATFSAPTATSTSVASGRAMRTAPGHLSAPGAVYSKAD
jgi:hypothetical protein